MINPVISSTTRVRHDNSRREFDDDIKTKCEGPIVLVRNGSNSEAWL
jgi:hypothetical protein